MNIGFTKTGLAYKESGLTGDDVVTIGYSSTRRVGLLLVKYTSSNDSRYTVYAFASRDDGNMSFTELHTTGFYDTTVTLADAVNGFTVTIANGAAGTLTVEEISI